jgi:FkbM family methyltransferase
MGLRTQLRKLLKYDKPSEFLNESYSQEGEDLILNRFYDNKPNGFFVDIGAHHPLRYSNTYKFYKKGWRGINIDAMPGSMEPFKKIRPDDINLEMPVSDKKETLPFYIFKETALNSFSKEHADALEAKSEHRVESVVNIQTDTLLSILDNYLPVNIKIDFMSIDAEGFDFNIVKSNDWQKYRPGMVLLESEPDPDYFLSSDLYRYMQDNDYSFYAKSFKTFFVKDNNLKPF